VTEYFYSEIETISEKSGEAWTDYIFFGDLRIAKQTGSGASTATYLHADHLGSIRRCTDANGNSNGECDCEPFGEYQPPSQSSCSALPTNFRFAGMFFDPESGGHGLYHTWFRQYDPAQGRWMSVDPLAGAASDPASLNRFAYVLADPVNLADLLGLQAPQQPPQPPNVPVEDSYEYINGQLVVCKVDGITIPCAEFVAFGFFAKLLRQNLEADVRNVRRQIPCPYPDDCTIEWETVLVVTYKNTGLLRLLGLYDWLKSYAKFMAEKMAQGVKEGGCERLFFTELVGNMRGPGLGSLGPVVGVNYSIYYHNAALQHAMSAKNYLGGQGLMFPYKSSIFRGLASKAGQGAAIGFLTQLDIALVQSLATEVGAIRSGTCR
jgi:RHS repeat-associated protein